MRHIFPLVVAMATASSALADLRITEVMSSSSSASPTPDWFEVTNYGPSAVSLSDWRMDDGSFNLAAAVALSGISSIGAGESVVFIESAAGSGIAAFRANWGGLSGIQVGYYSGSGVGLSSSVDGVGIFSGAGTLVTQVSFGAATGGSSFFWGYGPGGVVNPSYNGLVSTVGAIGGQVAYTASNGDVGSIGTAIAIPAPGAIALVGLVAIRGRRRR